MLIQTKFDNSTTLICYNQINKDGDTLKTKQKRKRKKRLRLKTEVKRFLIYFAFFIYLISFTIKESIIIYKDFQYQKTYEYKLIQVGYTKKDANILIDKLADNILDRIITEEKPNEHYKHILTQKYYLDKNFDTYVEYKTYHESTSYEDVIAIVNVNANKGWYNETYETNLKDNYLMIVNKFYYLDSNFKRDDLSSINLSYAYANNSAANIVIENFSKMHTDIKNELGVHLMVNSSYRSYNDQQSIYNDFKNISLKYADSYAARPGHSEHQTGLAIDLTSLQHPYVNDTENSFDKSEEYEWLKQNCHKYGFILRYPQGKEHITGYNTESWHFRYVGIEAATTIFKENITFDEYYAFYIAK